MTDRLETYEIEPEYVCAECGTIYSNDDGCPECGSTLAKIYDENEELEELNF